MTTVHVDDFRPAQRRHVVRAPRGYRAFVPPPLPTHIDLDPALARKLSDADRAIGELAGVSRTLPHPELLSRPLLRREAVLSSRIEGTRASLSDLVLFEIDEPAVGEDDAREVHNYVRAADHLFALDRRLPLSLPLLLETHGMLMSGLQVGHVTPGEFRRTQNGIGPPGSVIDTASYVPPPPERLWECLDPLEKYLHAPRSAPPLLDIAAVHYQFEAIHPFLDGNGRIGRLLISLLLVEWGLLPGPVLDLSGYLEPRREAYYAGLRAVSTDGDWAGWYGFMLDGFTTQAQRTVHRAHRLQGLREEFRSRVAASRAAGLPTLIEELFRVPAMTITRAQALLGVTHRAATQNVEKLVAAGILREARTKGRRRMFLCEAVIVVVEEGDFPVRPRRSS